MRRGSDAADVAFPLTMRASDAVRLFANSPLARPLELRCLAHQALTDTPAQADVAGDGIARPTRALGTRSAAEVRSGPRQRAKRERLRVQPLVTFHFAGKF